MATPIGNRSDISERALEVLRQVDLIAVEDTRHSGPLLKMWGISAKMLSYHDHNENARSEQLIEKLKAGHEIALISDAGTPLISDPGYVIVKQCLQAGIKVIPLPGPSAVITALCVSGLPTDRFSFEGFCPRTGAKRKQLFGSLQTEQRTMVFYESSHRIVHCLNDMLDVWGEDRKVAIARELTKIYETVMSGSLEEICAMVSTDPNQQKGEFVIVVDGALPAEHSSVTEEQKLLIEDLLGDLAVSRIAGIMTHVFGGKKKVWYQQIQEIKDK